MMIRLLAATILALSTISVIHAISREERAFHARCNALRKPGDEASDNDTVTRRLERGNDYYLPKCRGGTDESWFNFDAEIKKISPRCNEKDRFIMGALVSELVREIECSIPEYQEEIFVGKLCEMPESTNRQLVLEDSSRRELSGTWTYYGGGRCKRCQSGRRVLRDLKELTEEVVCSFAANARLGVKIAENSVQDAHDTYEEIMDLAAVFYDAKKGAKMVEDAEKKMLEAEEHEREAKREAKMTEEWCKQGIRDGSTKSLKKALDESEKSGKKAMEETIKTAESSKKIMDVKINLMQEEVKHDADMKKDKVKALVKTMKEDVDSRRKKLDEEMKKKKEKKEEEKKKGNHDKVQELEAEIKGMEKEQKKLGEESKEAAKFLEEGTKMDEKIELLRVALINTDDEEDWLKTFAKLLQEEIPKNLVYYYNVTSGGCLEETVYPDAKVSCWPVSKREETKPLEECELDFIYDD